MRNYKYLLRSRLIKKCGFKEKGTPISEKLLEEILEFSFFQYVNEHVSEISEKISENILWDIKEELS